MREGQHFLCRRSAMFSDSWTYGDWHQYVCWYGPTQSVCARHSSLPATSAILGLVLVLIVGMAVVTAPSLVNWDRALPMLLLGVALASWPYVLSLTGWWLMVAVGPPNSKSGTHRVFSHEVRDQKGDV